MNILDLPRLGLSGFDKVDLSSIMRKMTNILKSLEPVELMNLETRYIIDNPLAIISFLRQNRGVFEFLTGEAYRVVREYFPSEDLVLDVMSDPETDERMLVLYIQSSSNVQDALRKLRMLDENWWLDKASKYKNLCIHLQV